MSLRVALATDDGIRFVDRHFGDADYYYVYDIDELNVQFIRSIPNESVDEKKHTDPKKAKSILKILKEDNVQVGVNLQFGPNIKRVKKHIVPVIIDIVLIDEGLNKLIDNYDKLMDLWKKGKDRTYLKF